MAEGWQFLTEGVDYDRPHLATSLDRYEMAVDDAIAACGGDTHGALRALIIANEFLERDLEKLLARECSRNSG